MAGLIAQDWIEPYGGAEKVLAALINILPEAELACLWNSDPRWADVMPVHESWLAKTPLRDRKALALPLMSGAWRTNWRHLEPEWVMTSSYVFAHHLNNTFPGVPKFNYVHSPARYLWAPEFDERGKSLLVKAAAQPLRALDRRAAANNGEIAANSKFIRDRIRRAWHRDAIVIYPPVDAAEIVAGGAWAEHLTAAESGLLETLPAREFLLAGSRMVPYKGHSTVIEMGNMLHLPVVLTGSGPVEGELRQQAKESDTKVYFLGRVSNEMLRALYQRALAFVFPPVEDFGIMPVEAMAAGSSVIANRIGGAAETIVDGITGALFDPADKSSWANVVDKASKVQPAETQARAIQFDVERFNEAIRGWWSTTIDL